MKRILFALACLFVSFTLPAQGSPDSDGDGVSDSEDACPSIKGTAANKGCPAADQPQACNYISEDNFTAILSAVCSNTVHRQTIGKIENNKSLLTSFPLNGAARNLPVYYQQRNANNYSTTIGLTTRLADTSEVLACINELFRKSVVCNGIFSGVLLTAGKSGWPYTDVYASEEGGIFFYLEKVKTGTKTLVQLRITRLIYADAQKKSQDKTPPPPPPAPKNECEDFQKILDECIAGYGRVKGSLVKEETPAKYYTTTLPALGLTDKYVVESLILDISEDKFDRKKVIYYSAEKAFTSKEDALAAYEQLRNRVKKCASGTANVTDDTNQKIYELFMPYKGYTLRVAIIYLNFFSSNVSISVKLAD